MKDINNYIKENDTDNVTLNKLKELGTKLTGQENVQGETVADVLDFINSNYSGGGGGTSINTYNFKMTDVYYQDIIETSVKSIGQDIFINIEFKFNLGNSGLDNYDNHFVTLGYINLTDNENNTFKSKGIIPVVYVLPNSTINYNGNLRIEYDTSINTNKVELIIDTQDMETWGNMSDFSLKINVIGSGIIQTVIE